MRKDPHLPSQEQTQVSQPSKGEGRVSRRKRTPAVMEFVVRRFGADVYSHQGIFQRTRCGFTAVE